LLAVSQEKEVLVTGGYFYHQQPRSFHPAAADPAVQEKYLSECARLSGVAFPAMAAQGQGTGPGSGPCAEDIAKVCKDVQPGGGRILKCMKEHENELSPACKQHVAQVKEKAMEAKEACQDDVMKFCADVKPGHGRILKCLKGHENELSPDCKAMMASRGGRR